MRSSSLVLLAALILFVTGGLTFSSQRAFFKLRLDVAIEVVEAAEPHRGGLGIRDRISTDNIRLPP